MEKYVKCKKQMGLKKLNKGNNTQILDKKNNLKFERSI